jgi:REP element-mobilizing transposase RayT
MKRIYLLSTDHLEESLWFREDEDFKVGMNYVAIEVARKPNVSVLSFILMSNHVHFVLKGTREDAIAFVEDFKMRY